MTRAQMAWRVAGVVDPTSLIIDGDVIRCTVELADHTTATIIAHDGKTLEMLNSQATLNGVKLKLTPLQWAVLVYMAREPGCYRTAAEIYQVVWGSDYSKLKTRAVDQVMCRLRKQLPKGWLHHKVGYGFELLP